MNTKPQQPKERGGTLSSLNVAIQTLNLAKEISSVTPAKAVFGSVSVLLTMIRDSMENELEYVELGLSCADICKSPDRGMHGRRLEDFSRSVSDAINQLTTTVAEIQRKVIKRRERNPVSRLFHAKDDAGAIAAWKLDLTRILQVFNTELSMNTHTIVVDMHQNMLRTRDIRNSMAGESPPPPPRACFGRGELIEKIVGLAENFTPIALIGAGGIGKTSTALTVLHDDRIKQRFGDNRRFIRCDKFPASLPHFLHRLSMAIGAGVENPEDLAPLRPFLSSRKIFIVLDNVESILDPRGMDAQEIYDMVEELSQFNNVCLCLTSRISIVPPACKSLDVPTLSMEAAHDAFYYIYEHGERSDQVSNVLKQLDFHPLSVTLLATVALHNKWSADRLTKEWGKRRTGVLHTQHDKSLAATVELSLASPMFQELGPDARELLGVVAFFPQGVDENNLGWLFPAMPDITNVFDTFCNLSLTYKSGGFVTMLAPLRDYLSPKVPESSQLLWATKWHYFGRLTVNVGPENPGFEEARWIMSEDVNIEHLLDVFTSIDADSNAVWNACSYFMQHLYWHKPRLVVLGLKIEELPDSHPSKPRCLHRLSQLFASVGNRAEEKRLLGHALRICGELGNDLQVAQTLLLFCRVNQKLGLNEEGLSQAKEALEIYERFHNVFGQVQSLLWFAWMLCDDNQVDAAEEAGSRALDLSSGEGNQFQVSNCHRLLGHIYSLKKEIETAIYHFKGALEIASHFNWRNEQLLCHSSLADLFADEGRFSDAHIHIEHSRSHAVDDPYNLGCVLKQHAHILRAQGRLEEAKFEAFHATAVFEKLGAAHDLERSRWLLQGIQEEMNNSAAIHKQDDGGQDLG